MKKILYLLLVFAIIFPSYTYAEGVDDIFDANVRQGVERAFEGIDTEYDAIDVIDKLNHGEFEIDVKGVWGKFKVIISKAFKENFLLLSQLFVLVMLSALLENLHIAIKDDKLTKMIVACIVVLGLVSVTYNVAEYSIEFLDSLILFINSLLPTLITLLATGGKISTSGILNPIMLGVSSVISLVIGSFVVPLSMMGLVLKLGGNITQKAYLSNFGQQIYNLLKWILGLVFTAYVGIISIVGVTAPKIDEITLKTTKYAVGSFIPYVGGMVADSVDLLLACSSVVKNSVGIAGLLGIFSIIALPCLKLTVNVLSVKMLEMVISPVAGKNIIGCVNNISSCLSLLLGMNVAVSIMYILSVTVIIFIGGA